MKPVIPEKNLRMVKKYCWSDQNFLLYPNDYIKIITICFLPRLSHFGRPTYPCMECLLTKYKYSAELTEAQQTYNVKLDLCRNISVEKSFRLLKQRFRQLNCCQFTDSEQMGNFVTACCVLHNLSREDDFNFFEPNIEKDNAPAEEAGRKIRDRVCHEMQLHCNITE